MMKYVRSLGSQKLEKMGERSGRKSEKLLKGSWKD
jgi:hypothetical protein